MQLNITARYEKQAGGRGHLINLFLATIAFFLGQHSNCYANDYQISTIDIPHSNITVTAGINDLGQMAGFYHDETGYHGYYLGSISTNPFTINVPGQIDAAAVAINNSGGIVGTFGGEPFESSSDGYFLNNVSGSFSNINFPDATHTIPNGLNSSGQITGFFIDSGPNNDHNGFLRDGFGGEFTPFSYFTGMGPEVHGDTHANGINDLGKIVGMWCVQGECGTGAEHGFLLTAVGGNFITIDIPGAKRTTPRGINNFDQIVGSFEDDSGQSHGFIRKGDLYSILDVPGANSTYAIGINNEGEIVGAYSDTVGQIHGFIALSTAITIPEPRHSHLLFAGLIAIIACVRMKSRYY